MRFYRTTNCVQSIWRSRSPSPDNGDENKPIRRRTIAPLISVGLGVKRVIETNRLILRRFQRTDLPSLDAILGDREVMAFSESGTLSIDAQAQWIENRRRSPQDGRLLGSLALETKASTKIVGYISLDADPERVAPGELELGYRLARFAWGQGYATEAARAVIAWARKTSLTRWIIALVDPHNTASIKVLERLRFSYARDSMLPGYDYPDHVYRTPLA